MNSTTPLTTTTATKTSSATDMSRRMVCGGLAGMIAKVRSVNWGCVCCCDDERASVTHWQDGHCLTVFFSLSP
jgi:hypothetical protein